MSQIVERFEAAVQVLVADGPVKRRLLRAYREYLEDLQQVDIPIPGKDELSELHAALQCVPPMGEIDCVKASVQKMAPAEAWWHACTIVRLYTEILAMEQGARPHGEGRPEPLEDVSASPPRFLLSNS